MEILLYKDNNLEREIHYVLIRNTYKVFREYEFKNGFWYTVVDNSEEITGELKKCH